MEGSCALHLGFASASTCSASAPSVSKPNLQFGCFSNPFSPFHHKLILKPKTHRRKLDRVLVSPKSSITLLSPALSEKSTNPTSSSSSSVKDIMPKIDKSGRFCSPRAARELAIIIAYASCLEGCDPVRLFEKRLNAKREPGYEFNKAMLLEYNHLSFGEPPIYVQTEDQSYFARNKKIRLHNDPCLAIIFQGKLPVGYDRFPDILSLIWEPGYEFNKAMLLEYNHLSFGEPPIYVQTEEEEEKLLRKYEQESVIEAEVLLAPPKLVYSKLILRLTKKMLVAVVDAWDDHVTVIDKIAPPNWKSESATRILELCILRLAMAEITVLGTRHQIVINEAVHLAKRFCDGTAPRIINGCLRTFVQNHVAEDVIQPVEIKL